MSRREQEVGLCGFGAKLRRKSRENGLGVESAFVITHLKTELTSEV